MSTGFTLQQKYCTTSQQILNIKGNLKAAVGKKYNLPREILEQRRILSSKSDKIFKYFYMAYSIYNFNLNYFPI